MRSAKKTLEIIENLSNQNPDYEFHRIYRELYNPDLLLRAYLKLAPNEGNMTRGVDGKTIDGFGIGDIEKIIEDLRNERYYPNPARREFIPKTNGKLRPLGIPTFRDKVVQEALKELLEAIYEPIFLDCSHGFRPGRSCHTALSYIRYHCHNTTWAVEGDLVSFFDNIDHDILLKIISRKVKDGRVIELIRRFLKAGYVEDSSFKESLLGSPQGGVLSPLLANIFLHEFDTFVESLKMEYTKGTSRRVNPEYSTLSRLRKEALKKGDSSEARNLLKKMRNTWSMNPMDPNFARVQYLRYADDWVIFCTGSKKMALEIKERCAEYLKDELGLQLNEDKTHITNLSDENIRFLGYEIHKIRNDTKLYRDSRGVKKRMANGKIALLVPWDVISKRIASLVAEGKPVARDPWLNNSVEQIISGFSSEFRGLYNYYRLASNVSTRMNSYRYYHERSMLKTIAKKEKSSVRKVQMKYEGTFIDDEGLHRRTVMVKDGENIRAYYKNWDYTMDSNPVEPRRRGATDFGPELKSRILKGICELCNSACKAEVHVVRNLSKTTERYERTKKPLPRWLSIMNSMHRKTLVVCHGCHIKLHRGKPV